ncbi:hypothetical protein EDB89DRAFT_2072053 [Lactarius sanguifluus]|nr:hypothetical protein EDB89DRAFT_2072053 [Lactarius sanguifluus]
MEIAGQQQQDRATLCSLAFSDYQLWTNPFLRDPNRDGFTSIRTLFRRSHIFLNDNDDAFEWTEASVVKCMSRDFFDLRMILVDTTRPRFAGGPEYWDARTVYIENIPHSFRSTLGICKLLRVLLNSSSAKAFALVTLNEPDVVFGPPLPASPTTATTRDRPPTTTDEDLSVEESEARKAGFRTLSKERWDTLQAEYVEYRESLLRRIAAAASSTEPAPNKIKSTHDPPEEPERAPAANMPQTQSYPSGCVLFARHVPPDTNKTALRTRFSALLADTDALDYVDYSKGLDSCYLRLKTRKHAQALLEAARSEHGTSVQEPELELLEGRREEMYWENVPEKVRALAVQRARANEDEEDTQDPGSQSQVGGTRRKRRR